jgi:hypothetical protein
MSVSWNAADRAGSIALALIAFRFVFGGIPRVENCTAGWTDRDAVGISFWRNGHEPAPILGNKTDPITREIIRRCGLSGRRRGSTSAAAATLYRRTGALPEQSFVPCHQHGDASNEQYRRQPACESPIHWSVAFCCSGVNP